MNRLLRRLIRLPRQLLIWAVRGYQFCISPLLGPHCRFTPTCSAYFIESVERYGVFRGGWRGVRRIFAATRFTPEAMTRRSSRF